MILTTEAKARVLDEVAFMFATGNLRQVSAEPEYEEAIAFDDLQFLPQVDLALLAAEDEGIPADEVSLEYLEDYLNFARLKLAGNTKKVKECKAGYPCGYTCISGKKACNSGLSGQAKTYADWLKSKTKAYTSPYKFKSMKDEGKVPKVGDLVHVFSGSVDKPILRTQKVVGVSQDGETVTVRPTQFTKEQKDAIAAKPNAYDQQVLTGFIYDRKINRADLLNDLETVGGTKPKSGGGSKVTVTKLQMYDDYTQHPQYQKDLTKMVKMYVKQGKSAEDAKTAAENFLKIYANGYRVKPA